MSPSRAGLNADAASEADPAVIEEEIEATRAEMTETIEAIQERLAPEQLAEQAKEVAHHAIDEAQNAVRELAGQATTAAREATMSKAQQMAVQTRDTAQSVKGDLWTTTKQNPVPVALAAFGIGWMWTRRSRSSGDSRFADYGAYGIESRQQDQSSGQLQGMAGRVGQVPQQTRGLWQMVEANPLAAGAVAAMLGGITGLIIPETEKEHQFMGETRDRLMNEVRIAGNQAVDSVQERVLGSVQDRVQEVAEQAVETVMDKAQGVMPKSGGQSGTST